VGLIGDAAHATSPSSGQGASMAIEDALELARCLRDLPDVPRALTAYEGLRRARVERVVAIGKRTGDGKVAGPIGRVIRDLVLPMFLRREAHASSWGWLFERPLTWEARVEGGA
jgi:2-polyprenyl-6-methoxyphenol hydroxylase-like FAD-dependent oxidoreductase